MLPPNNIMISLNTKGEFTNLPQSTSHILIDSVAGSLGCVKGALNAWR